MLSTFVFWYMARNVDEEDCVCLFQVSLQPSHASLLRKKRDLLVPQSRPPRVPVPSSALTVAAPVLLHYYGMDTHAVWRAPPYSNDDGRASFR